MALLHFSWKGNVFVVYLHWHLQYISVGTCSISYFSVVVYLLKNKDSTKMQKSHFSRRLSVSLTTFVDAFIESSLKVFTLPSFPSWYCLHLRKDGQAGFRAFLFGKNACPSMGHSFLPVFRSDGLSYHPDFFVWPGKDRLKGRIDCFAFYAFFFFFFCLQIQCRKKRSF